MVTLEMKSYLSGLISFSLLCLFPLSLARAEITDRMLAIVNGKLITESEVIWALALDPGLQPLDLSPENKRLMLERLIDQRILDSEAEKVPQEPPTEAEITNYINNELIKEFGSEAAFRDRLQKVGLDHASLREIVLHRLEMLKYIDFRFRAFVFLKPEEVERYYREVELPRMRNRGGRVRSLDEMRAQIEATLIEERVNAELDRFLDEARLQAEIIRLPQLP